MEIRKRGHRGKKNAHCGGIYRRSRTLFVLYIAELRGVSSTFQMAFTAQTRMPLTIAFRKSRLAGTVRAAQPSAPFTCRVPRSHSECGGRAGFCLSKVLIVGAVFLLIQIFFFSIYGASCPVFFDLDTEPEAAISIWRVMQEDNQLAVFLFSFQYYCLFIFAALCNVITGKCQDHGVHMAPLIRCGNCTEHVYGPLLSKALTLHICGGAAVYPKMRFRWLSKKVSD